MRQRKVTCLSTSGHNPSAARVGKSTGHGGNPNALDREQIGRVLGFTTGARCDSRHPLRC